MDARAKTAVLALTAAGGLATVGLATGIGGAGGIGGPDRAQASALDPFADCEELAAYAREHRWAQGGVPYAGGGVVAMAESTEAAADAGAATRALPAEPGAVGPGESGTNVQEAGIDEPDLAKLSGTTLFRVRESSLVSYDVSGDEAVLLDELEIGRAGGAAPEVFAPGTAGAQLLISGDRALVLGSGMDRAGVPTTNISEVDISDPAAMTAVRHLELEGTEVSARLQGSTVRLVIESQPDFPGLGGGPSPRPLPLPEAAPQTGASGEEGPESETEPGWLPQAVLTDLETGERAQTVIAGCEDISFPREFSGLGLLSVLTIDLQEGLAPADVEAVMTNGASVYASAESLYVSTPALTTPPPGVVERLGSMIAPDATTIAPATADKTLIHRFDTSSSAETEYAASGEVQGRLIGQFAMSEHDGVLRVASTRGDTWTEGSGESESLVTTLGESDGQLEEVGRVGGLGPGEEIYAVRFIGETAYVVTFEQTDPLYTVDLSDPAAPEVTGELKIPGYSAYLHPVGDGLLLGIGQAGIASGTITGAQASLFDVADPESPERLDALDLTRGRYGQTATEWDHHAFLYSPEHALAVVPVQSYGRKAFDGAVAVGVEADGTLVETARLDDPGQIERTLMAGERLVTVSTKGVELRALSELR
jgi:uncharacterized secreted protein with C-terminal beta-propeller domain